jgi:hypothetical protein
MRGPSGAHAAGGGTGAHAQPVAEPAARGGRLDAVFGAGGAAGVHAGQRLEPVALRRSSSRHSSRTRSAATPSGRPVRSWRPTLHGCGQGGQLIWWPGPRSGGSLAGCPVGWSGGCPTECLVDGWIECVFRSMAATHQPLTRTRVPTQGCGQPSPQVHRTQRHMGWPLEVVTASLCRTGSGGWQRTSAPRRPPCQAGGWGPTARPGTVDGRVRGQPVRGWRNPMWGDDKAPTGGRWPPPGRSG